MPRQYKRVSDRGKYGQSALTAALDAIKGGCSLKKAERDFGVPRKTLRRHRDGKVLSPGTANLGGCRTVLHMEFERQLVAHIQTMESALFGLTTVDVRKLAYQLAEKLHLNHRFNTSSKMAGLDWLRGFLSRNADLSIRSPQGTSLTRAVGFNRPKVNQFFELYKSVLSKGNFDGTKIWNMDETGITTVQKPTKIVATKGKRQVSKITSGERGQLVTAICCMSAAGQFTPPMLIFPRSRMSDLLMKDAPVGSIGVASPSGWTDGELFVQWLQHFVKSTGSSDTNQQILILDGHHSHKTLDAVMFAREHGVHMLTLPPHCTHKLQPLDRSFFKSFKANYNRSADSWMLGNAGKRISMYDVAGIFGNAYNHTANIEKANSGFRSTGLWPFNDLIFTDDDFSAAQLTDEPQPQLVETTSAQTSEVASDGPTTGGSELAVTASPENDDVARRDEVGDLITDSDASPNADRDGLVQHGNDGETAAADVISSVAGPTSSNADNDMPSSVLPHPGLSEALQILNDLSPIPKIKTARIRKRKAESAQILTSSPFKKQLEDKSAQKKKTKTTSSKKAQKKQAKRASHKNQTKRPSQEKTSLSETDQDETPCIICSRRYNEPPPDTWTQCTACRGWYHDSCGPDDVDLCYNCVN